MLFSSTHPRKEEEQATLIRFLVLTNLFGLDLSSLEVSYGETCRKN